jgi:hypothetical protein
MQAFSLNMVRPRRFERLTARFVAEYSIQLSYGRVLRLAILTKFAVYEINISYISQVFFAEFNSLRT